MLDLKREPLPSGGDEELRSAVEDGWKRLRKGTNLENESLEQMEYELDLISRKGFSQYFLNVLEIMRAAWDLGVLSGPGRGSAAGSEVAYLLGITRVDPIKYHLSFSRFLSEGRTNFPDIDCDFSSVLVRERTKVLLLGREYDETDLVQTKSHGELTAREVYDLVCAGESVEV